MEESNLSENQLKKLLHDCYSELGLNEEPDYQEYFNQKILKIKKKYKL